MDCLTIVTVCCTLLHVSKSKEKLPVSLNPTRAKEKFVAFKYGDEMRMMAMALRDQGSSRSEISKKLGISTSTVHAFISESKLDDISHSDLASKFKARMANELILNANSLFDTAMHDEKMEKASTLQLITAGSILIDKARLLAGESTENISVRVKHINETESELKSLRDEISSLEKGIADTVDVEQLNSDTLDAEQLNSEAVRPLNSRDDTIDVEQLYSSTVEEIDFI